MCHLAQCDECVQYFQCLLVFEDLQGIKFPLRLFKMTQRIISPRNRFDSGVLFSELQKFFFLSFKSYYLGSVPSESHCRTQKVVPKAAKKLKIFCDLDFFVWYLCNGRQTSEQRILFCIPIVSQIKKDFIGFLLMLYFQDF